MFFFVNSLMIVLVMWNATRMTFFITHARPIIEGVTRLKEHRIVPVYLVGILQTCRQIVEGQLYLKLLTTYCCVVV